MKGPKVYPITRDRDEELIRWLLYRSKSALSASAIARRLGVAPGQYIRDTSAVLAADLAESGEDPATVRKAYWGAPT